MMRQTSDSEVQRRDLKNLKILINETNIRGEICKKEVGNLTMCPECPQFCDFRFGRHHPIKESYFSLSFKMNYHWNDRVLKESCPLYRLAWIFDHSLTPLFAFFMSLWGETVYLILSAHHPASDQNNPLKSLLIRLILSIWSSAFHPTSD